MIRRSFAIITLTFTILTFAGNSSLAAQCKQSGKPTPCWMRQKPSGPVVVFVHGILSDSVAAWSNAEQYWPRLVANDRDLNQPAIFVAGYYASWDSQTFTITHAADSLASQLESEGVTRHRDILFVAHSLGGIVVRDLLSRVRPPGDTFAGKRIGLLLLSSPARGSELARALSKVADSANNRLARELQPESDTLARVHTAFWNLTNGRQPHRKIDIAGVELFESQGVDLSCLTGGRDGSLWSRIAATFVGQAAPIDSAGWYFSGATRTGDTKLSNPPRQLGGVDHCRISKPAGPTDDSYIELSNLFKARFGTPNIASPPLDDLGFPQAEVILYADDVANLASQSPLLQVPYTSLLAHVQTFWPKAKRAKLGIRVQHE